MLNYLVLVVTVLTVVQGFIPPCNNVVNRYQPQQQQRQQQQQQKRYKTLELTASTSTIASAAAKVVSNTDAGKAITIAALSAVSKLLSTCGIGVLASKAKILDKNTLSVLSKLIFNLLQPCLLFTNVADTVTKLNRSGGGSSIFLIPMIAAVQLSLGFTIGKIVSFLLYGKKSSEESKQLLTCTTFGNSGPLPLVFVDAILKHHKNSLYLPQSIGYISLYLLGWSPLFWIFAPAILSDDKDNSKTDIKVVLSRVFSPPVFGCLVGLLVGSVPIFRNVLVNQGGLLNPVFEAIKTLGQGYLPAVLLVLAGSLYPPKEADSINKVPETVASNTENKQSNVEYFKQIAAIYISRFVITPSVGFLLIKLANKHSPMLAKMLSDPVLVFVLLLEFAMPSAQNSTVILQLQKKSDAAARMARVLLAVYVLGVPAISYWLVKILTFTGL